MTNYQDLKRLLQHTESKCVVNLAALSLTFPSFTEVLLSGFGSVCHAHAWALIGILLAGFPLKSWLLACECVQLQITERVQLQSQQRVVGRVDCAVLIR